MDARLLVALSFLLCFPQAYSQANSRIGRNQAVARSVIRNPVTGERVGNVTIRQLTRRGILISGVIYNLTPGNHGWHIHELGDLGEGCGGAGPHFNPFRNTHGAPSAITRHVGDLGNIVADGEVSITQLTRGVYITGKLTGLSDGQHGFHIHQWGDDLKTGCKGAKGHYNPYDPSKPEPQHGAPNRLSRHVGDLGNILAVNRTAEFQMRDFVVSLRGKHSVIGRAFVVGCGVIGVASDNFED